MENKIFISYSWTTPKHEKWVITLAEKLTSDGIEVIIDKWDLKEGHDKYSFMETMVKSPEINKVLLILDQKYTEKADLREGGVGTEAQIISPKIYNDITQDKFIPIVCEKDGEGNPYIPTFLESRIYIDLTNNDRYEENYEKLIRNIYNRPSYSKPKLGTPPSYIFEESPKNYKTSQLLRTFEYHLNSHPNRVNSTIKEFLDSYFENLKEFSINFPSRDSNEIGKLICENHQKYIPLRNEFVKFIEILTNTTVNFDFDSIVVFLEKLPLLEEPPLKSGSYSPVEFDNFRIIIFETFLYLVVIGLKNENYIFLENIFYSSYFTKGRENYNNHSNSFEIFYRAITSLDRYYKDIFTSGFVNPMADLLIKSIPKGISTTNIVQADLLCYNIASLNNKRWFPQTYNYDRSGSFELYYKMVSKKHFEKVKILFDVDTVEYFRQKLTELKTKDEKSSGTLSGYGGPFSRIIPVYQMIDLNELGTKR